MVPPWTPASDDGRIHVAFVDSRTPLNVHKLLLAARLYNTSTRVQLHAVVKNTRVSLPGFRVHELRLRSHAACIHRGFAALTHGPGAEYMYKPLLHWIIPDDVKRLIVVDHDTILVRPIGELWAEFERFGGALIGVGNEQTIMYQQASNWTQTGKNGGVQLLDLAAMRASADYANFLDSVASGEQGYIGFLGDQTLYTRMTGNSSHSRFLYNLPCQWNRQLSLHFSARNASVHRCGKRCGIMHANWQDVKCLAPLMQQNATCANWKLLQTTAFESTCPGKHRGKDLLTYVRAYHADCCIGTPLGERHKRRA